ncbi:alpha/beta hydrolase [Hoyosella sp. YIM 151337]|uniref:alpha/beta hydrolase n=1 Tax=Hoyosella sp. YIM 151337 TaxID=2992742 RepID=UPI002236775D|nr:alpha/beta hydrolase [Hoyosella sp. YIM 151337]MCW4353646.1 alpha/beta hydrolase [Hoyosella sp. YIM 151337]
MARTDVTFPAGDGTCAAWLYQASSAHSAGKQPIIVMAHGLGGVREMRLDAFAERFQAAGYACLVFDYRHFGASSGEPRQLLDIGRQLEDWTAAVAHARTIDGIDSARVVVWGTSFGGGHAIITAARDHRIAAAIVQCPFTDGLASTRAIPALTTAKLTALAVRDHVAALRGADPVRVATYGPPGSTALMSAPDAEPGIRAITPAGVQVPSEVAARFALQIVRHFPGRYARKVQCPILFVICESDTVAPAGPTRKYAAQAPRGEVTLTAAGHFDIYVGDDFERNVADQLAFLARHVPVPS